MAMAMPAFHPALAQTHVQVFETWPAGDTITLGQNQNFYLHLSYTSDQPVQIWARPYLQGEPADAGSNPSRVYPAGSGEELGWFFLFDPGAQVDEVRISAGDVAQFSGFMLAMIAFGLLGFAWPAWGLWRWRGGWRIAAAAPILVMGFVVLRIVIDTARDPTSHNLWPFEVVMWGVLGCGWMMALALARKLAGAKRA